MPRTLASGEADRASLWKVLTRPSFRLRLQPAGTWNFTPKCPSLKHCGVACAGGAVGITIFCCAAHGSVATQGENTRVVPRKSVVRRPIALIVAFGGR